MCVRVLEINATSVASAPSVKEKEFLRAIPRPICASDDDDEDDGDRKMQQSCKVVSLQLTMCRKLMK